MASSNETKKPKIKNKLNKSKKANNQFINHNKKLNWFSIIIKKPTFNNLEDALLDFQLILFYQYLKNKYPALEYYSLTEFE